MNQNKNRKNAPRSERKSYFTVLPTQSASYLAVPSGPIRSSLVGTPRGQRGTTLDKRSTTPFGGLHAYQLMDGRSRSSERSKDEGHFWFTLGPLMAPTTAEKMKPRPSASGQNGRL